MSRKEKLDFDREQERKSALKHLLDKPLTEKMRD
jgi:hypothetical protein